MAEGNFDIIVIGAGHAGIEASLACARRGLKTAVVTTNLDRIGYMSCNPAIGGLAKGHMVREIDVLGGQMGLTTDQSCIQFKRLNASKGPAVRGSRAQCDKDEYSRIMTQTLLMQSNLKVISGEAKEVVIQANRAVGIRLGDDSKLGAKAIVVTSGTFMNGVMHLGAEQTPGGRVGDKASVGLSDQLRSLGFRVQRLKTGTPARLLRDSIDWSKTSPQGGDADFFPFSYRSERRLRLPQVLCYLGYTNEKTHDVIRRNIHLSPMYCGAIEGSGPRYCPSIEDKITRFPDKPAHQTFLEPEGLNTDLIYLQGISTSLPKEVQDEFLRTISGLENVKVARYGYAVEYDFVDPTQLSLSLETRWVKGLFLAGQVNGTSGYEEAAAQGFLAGVNAGNQVLDREPLVLGRAEAYMGVLVDDLVTKGTLEPYRMFTSRAEHRLVLREDNTLERLLSRGMDLGLASEAVIAKAALNLQLRQDFLDLLETTQITPTPETQEKLRQMGSQELLKPISGSVLLRRPDVSAKDLVRYGIDVPLDPDIFEPVEIQVKYAGYIARQNQLIEQAKKMDSLTIPDEIDYSSIRGLSAEEIEKLDSSRPASLGQAGRISGVNPSAIQAILVYLKGHNKSFERGTDGRSGKIFDRNSKPGNPLEDAAVVS